MNYEIIEEPLRFRLHGIGGLIENERTREAGFRLMNPMWQAIKGAGIATTGLNHWVYLPAGNMFVGVELQNPQPVSVPAPLEARTFELPRHLRHVHVGPYQALPHKWAALKAELAARGEILGSPALEIYGHHHDDPAQLETTILIGLQTKAA